MAAAENKKNIEGDVRRPRVGLALGGGSARGWAHIGAIRALSEAGIEADIVCGSSIGALVGAAFTSGHLDMLQDWVCTLTRKDILHYMDITIIGGGFIKGERLMEFFQQHIQDTPIEALSRRFGAVATDLDTGQEVWFQDGSLLDAVRASIAFPGLFTPVRLRDRWLVDGGLVNPVPVSLCRALGAEFVIAVNLNVNVAERRGRSSDKRGGVERRRTTKMEAEFWEKFSAPLKNNLQERAQALLSHLLGSNRDAPGLFEVLTRSINIMQNRITRSRMADDPPDVVLTPRLSHIGLMDFDKATEAIEEGR